jgi:hypothetical protein
LGLTEPESSPHGAHVSLGHLNGRDTGAHRLTARPGDGLLQATDNLLTDAGAFCATPCFGFYVKLEAEFKRNDISIIASTIGPREAEWLFMSVPPSTFRNRAC